MTSNNAIAIWDFTLKEEGTPRDTVKKWCKEKCKKWCFQIECGESGYRHYQGKISLKVKSRNMCRELKPAHWSPSHTDDDFYVTKEETRVEGPWCDKDVEVYIPLQIRMIDELYPWQQFIIDDSSIFDTRTINYIWDPIGNSGKSTLVGWVRAYQLGRALPPLNNTNDMLRMVCDLPTAELYLIDMPRAMKKDKLSGFYSAIETIKDGYAYDDRYNFREKVFDCPCIWIFGNILPYMRYLSKDRWKIWEIDGKKKLKLVDPAALAAARAKKKLCSIGDSDGSTEE